MPYHECLQKLASKFARIRYQYVPRMQDQIASSSPANIGRAKGRASLLYVDKGRKRTKWERRMVFRYPTISQGGDIPKVCK